MQAKRKPFRLAHKQRGGTSPFVALVLGLVLSVLLAGCGDRKSISQGQWQLAYDKGICIRYGKVNVVLNISAEYGWNGRVVSHRDYSHRTFSEQPLADEFGTGKRWTVTYTDSELPTLTQRFSIYQDYVLTDISVESDGGVWTNYMAPVVVEQAQGSVTGHDLRALFVPFDNDAWVRFASRSLSAVDTLRSYEVTALYDVASRRGLVVGAIDHDHWKNAVELTGNARKLRVFSGVADELTRDRLPHGNVHGRKVTSARMMIGLFDDWREGLECFAKVNATVAPPRPWAGAMPVGWNSWGALAFKVNHDNATRTSDFFAQELQNHSFCNSEGLVYTGLDSGWNNFTEEELKDFADRCRRNNQVPCIYWTPFTDWGKNPEREVARGEKQGSTPGATSPLGAHAAPVKYKDLYLYANGRPQELDGAYALDPTHPAVQTMMEQTHELFQRCGYKYVKMDFMTHGRMEADSWYRKDVSTGTEAYNYGMHLLDSIFADMYLNLSISPIFPAQYAQSRRIACDAWNKIKDTEYTMNALSYGWWIDGIYQYNDADHVVLRDATEGENRARITSSVITGLYITGDDFSSDTLAISRARRYLTNPDINRLATGRSFRPLLGDHEQSEHVFLRTEPDGTTCLAVFNYGDKPLTFSFDRQLMQLTPETGYDAEELWSHTRLSLDKAVEVPAKDVLVVSIRPAAK